MLNVVVVLFKVESLSLAHTGIVTIENGALGAMPSLVSLDLRATPLVNYQSGVFDSILKLRSLYAEDAKLCCSYFHPKVITPPRNRGGLIFSLQFVCVCVCVSVCLSVCVSGILVNEIPAERMHRFGRGFRYMIAYNTGSDPIEFSDLGSKVKVTMTENVCKNDKK